MFMIIVQLGWSKTKEGEVVIWVSRYSKYKVSWERNQAFIGHLVLRRIGIRIDLQELGIVI